MPTKHKRTFIERHRSFVLALMAAGLILALGHIAPETLTTLLKKLAQLILGAVIFLWLDQKCWPFAQPESYLKDDFLEATGVGETDKPDYEVSTGYVGAFIAACLRQAGMVMIGGALAMALAL